MIFISMTNVGKNSQSDEKVGTVLKNVNDRTTYLRDGHDSSHSLYNSKVSNTFWKVGGTDTDFHGKKQLLLKKQLTSRKKKQQQKRGK